MATAKLDINKATKQQLIDLGIRPGLADSILKLRKEQGRLADLESLRSISGVGPATFEQLTDSLVVAATLAAETGQKMAGQAAEVAAAQTAQAGKVGEAMQAQAKRSVDEGKKQAEAFTGATREAAQSATAQSEKLAAQTTAASDAVMAELEKARAGFEQAASQVTSNISNGEFGKIWAETVNGQVEDGLTALKGLVAARNIAEVVELQTRFMTQSLERMVDFSSRSIDLIAEASGKAGTKPGGTKGR